MSPDHLRLMRAVSLRGFVDLAQCFGFDGFQLLKEAHIHPAELLDDERRLPARAVIQVLERAAEQTACENFGLLLARRRSFEELGPAALLMERLPTTRSVIEAAIEYRRYFNDLIDISIIDDGEEATISWDLFAVHNARQSVDLGVGLAYRLLTGSSGDLWRPDRVHLTHSSPTNTGPWKDFFACPIEFSSSFNGFTCSSRSLETKNPLANEIMAAHALRLLKLAPPEEVADALSERVQRAIGKLLPEGKATLAETSKLLEINPRTVQRMLEREGTSFSDLLESVKLEFAKRYLRNQSRSITTVSELLGYSSPGCFTRWFQKLHGMPPSDFRATPMTRPPNVLDRDQIS